MVPTGSSFAVGANSTAVDPYYIAMKGNRRHTVYKHLRHYQLRLVVGPFPEECRRLAAQADVIASIKEKQSTWTCPAINLDVSRKE